MSRSGYSEDCEDYWAFIRWRGAVTAATKGRRGQAFLQEIVAALDAMPVKRLIADELVNEDGEVCAIGAVCRQRGLDTSGVDPEDREEVAALVGVATALVAEIEWLNDEDLRHSTPEKRWELMRSWIAAMIVSERAADQKNPPQVAP